MEFIKDLGMHYPTNTSSQKRRYGLYKCPICESAFKVQTDSAKRGTSTKCKECASRISKTTHGQTGSRLHHIWLHMKKRCYTINNDGYKYYGEKGISICDEWIGGYVSFMEWAIDNGYKANLTIDRIDSKGNYEPSNCRWITKSENSIRSSTRDNYGSNKNIKISEDMASEICEAYATGLFTQTEIGEGYNVSSGTISLILKEAGIKKNKRRVDG